MSCKYVGTVTGMVKSASVINLQTLPKAAFYYTQESDQGRFLIQSDFYEGDIYTSYTLLAGLRPVENAKKSKPSKVQKRKLK